MALATAVATAVAVALAAAAASAFTSPPFSTFVMAFDEAEAAALADSELAWELDMAVDVTVPASQFVAAIIESEELCAWPHGMLHD